MDTSELFCMTCGNRNPVVAHFCATCGAPINKPVNNEDNSTKKSSSSQNDFISLACPNCGGKLSITPDLERFACQYCGNEQIVRRQGGVVSLEPVLEGIKRVETKFDNLLSGSDKMAAEKTIQRLKSEITELEKKINERETFIAANKPSKVNVVMGIIFFLLALASIPIIGSMVDKLEYGGWAYYIFCIFPIGLVIGGIWLITGSAATKNKKLTIQNAQADLSEIQSSLINRRKQLEELHHFTTQR